MRILIVDDEHLILGEMEELLMKMIPVYSTENSVFYDVKLQFSLDGGITWIDATEDNFPACGIKVKFDYPKGTSGDTHDFMISHMFAMTSDRLGTTAGETEQLQVTELSDGIQATFNGLSPVSISWKETAQTDPIVQSEPTEPTEKTETPTDSTELTTPTEETPTGDDFNMFPWVLAAAAAVGAGAVLGRKRKDIL